MGVDVNSFCIYGFDVDDDSLRIEEDYRDRKKVCIDEEENIKYIPQNILSKYDIEINSDGYSNYQAIGVRFLGNTIEETIENLKHAKEKLECFCKEADIDISKYDVRIFDGYYYW